MISEESLKDVPMNKDLREAIAEFFSFAEQEGISHWGAQEWSVERWTPGVDTLFLRPLFSDHSRHDHTEEIALMQDFLRKRTGNKRLQLGFFCPYGKNVPLRSELREIIKNEKSEAKLGIDYANLSDSMNIQNILGNEEK